MGKVFWVPLDDTPQNTPQGLLQAQGQPRLPALPVPLHNARAQEVTLQEAPTDHPARSPNTQQAAAAVMLWPSPRPPTPHVSLQVRVFDLLPILWGIPDSGYIEAIVYLLFFTFLHAIPWETHMHLGLFSFHSYFPQTKLRVFCYSEVK